ncbi:hypothetical protein FQZ97_1147050 [compost metagenome]
MRVTVNIIECIEQEMRVHLRFEQLQLCFHIFFLQLQVALFLEIKCFHKLDSSGHTTNGDAAPQSGHQAQEKSDPGRTWRPYILVTHEPATHGIDNKKRQYRRQACGYQKR